ncbi:MAG: hypothetical protein R2729_18380 [Bryobacteraceae bacterium]
MLIRLLLLALPVTGCMATAQAQIPVLVGPAIVGAGTHPEPLYLSPGQIITVYATGIGDKVTERIRATSQPWPTELSGISAELIGPGWKPAIGQVEPLATCPEWGIIPNLRCGRLLAVTLQVPFEINSELKMNSNFLLTLVLRDGDGNVTGAADVLPYKGQPKILRYCEVALLPNVNGVTRGASDCSPLVYHADGTRVHSANPAKEDEPLTIYLYGLSEFAGLAYEGARTGYPAGRAIDMRESYFMNYEFGDNVELTFGRSQPRLQADYIGTAPSEVGLFQANFRVPRIPSGVRPCGQTIADPISNLSIGIGRGSLSENLKVSPKRLPFDWIGLCVDPASRRPD